MNRFDYVAYDETAQRKQGVLKDLFKSLELVVTTALPAGRPQSLVLTKLEEAYMWCGKGIRDDQVARNGSAPLQEARTNS